MRRDVDGGEVRTQGGLFFILIVLQYKASLFPELFIQGKKKTPIDPFSLGGLLLHFRPCDDTLENSCFKYLKHRV